MLAAFHRLFKVGWLAAYGLQVLNDTETTKPASEKFTGWLFK